MPCRYIREGYLTSERVNSLNANAERFYFRLFLVVDDFGRYSANPRILRAECYPLKDNIRTTDISRWLSECENAGLLQLYTVDGKPYLQMLRFSQTRAVNRKSESRFPVPPESAKQLQTIPDGQQTNLAYNENENDNNKGFVARGREEPPTQEKTASGSSVEVVPYPKLDSEGINLVKQRAESIGYNISESEAENFIASYESSGWTRFGQKIRSWPALLVRWRNESRNGRNGGKGNADCRDVTLNADEFLKKPY